MGGPSVGVGSLEDSVDRLALDPSVEGDPHVLAPLIRGLGADRGPEDEQLPVAPGELARGEQEAAERQPGPEELGMVGEGREDVVVPEPRLDPLRDRLQDRLVLFAPLLRRQRRDPGPLGAPARGPTLSPPSTTRLWPVT